MSCIFFAQVLPNVYKNDDVITSAGVTFSHWQFLGISNIRVHTPTAVSFGSFCGTEIHPPVVLNAFLIEMYPEQGVVLSFDNNLSPANSLCHFQGRFVQCLYQHVFFCSSTWSRYFSRIASSVSISARSNARVIFMYR